MAENLDSKQDYMKSIYYNPKNPASFSGLKKFSNYIKKNSPLTISSKEIKHWLSNQDVYTTHAPVIRKFKRAKVISGYPRFQYDSDTAYMLRFADDNEGFSYFVTVIDVFTRFLFTFPIKHVKATEILKGLKNINEKYPPSCYRFDSGVEFKNKLIQNYLAKEGIKVFYTSNEIKAGYAERVIASIKSRLIKYMESKKNNKWIDVLQSVTEAYNNSIHSRLGISPKQALTTPKHVLWNKQHGEKPIKIKRELKKPRNTFVFKFKVGDKVRISYLRGAFDRQYSQKWTTEIFEITDRIIYHKLPIYRIKDYLNKVIGGVFYQSELIKVIEEEDRIYEIEKIIKRKTRNRERLILVKWSGYSSKFNSWVPENQIEEK